MKSRIFIYIHYMEIGGAERALLGLLNALTPDKCLVDLFINQHTGEFMSLIPKHVNVLPEVPLYTCIERPMMMVAREGHLEMVARRLLAKIRHYYYAKTLTEEQRRMDASIFQYVADAVDGALPSLEYLGEYDLAISFLQPHNIVLNKVKAKKKICWIHTDYSTIHVNHNQELRVWDGFDHVVSISEDCTKAFLNTFPELKGKIVLIENILSPVFVRQQADLEDVSQEMPVVVGETKILTIGRFSPQKKIEGIPYLCSILRKMGIRFKWYIIGYGSDELICKNIAKYNVEDCMIILGKRINPYPYIKACDIYCQPSIYEGKSVTVREALMLYKPTAITNFPTASSHFTDGTDGLIIPLEEKACAEALAGFIKNKELQQRFVAYMQTHDYGNEAEVEKIYGQMKD